jgi:hypothetical protein
VPAIEQARTEPGLMEWLLAQRRPTAISRRPHRQTEAFRHVVRLSYRAGTLFCAPLLSDATTVELFDLNGRTIFKTIAKGALVDLAPGTAGRVALWRLSRPGFSASGKLPIGR